MLKTPVLFLIFNRLDTTRQVFEKIREAQPAQLFIGADGPRPEKIGEAAKVAAVRKYVLDNIDWDCEVKTLFREENLGCGRAVSQAITWFFEHVEQGIILEDDTLPDLSFFGFCEELLHHYKEDERLMHITGANFLNGCLSFKESYYFSKYPTIWGWATWRNRWEKYVFNLTEINLKQLKEESGLYNFSKSEFLFWSGTLKNLKNVDTWDYQWILTIWLNQGISATSSVNLISNIGFGEDATHTFQTGSKVANLKTKKITKIIHPTTMDINYQADRFAFSINVQNKLGYTNILNLLFSGIISKLTQLLPRLKTLIYVSKN